MAVRIALLSLINDDRAGYKAMCRQMLDRFAATDDREAARQMCWACLIASPPVGDMDKLHQLLDVADLALQDSHNPLSRQQRGMAAYRSGEWEEALKWCAESRQQLDQDESHLHYRAQNLLVEAMALHELGKASDATATYDEAMKAIHSAFPHYSDTDLDDSRWLDWIAFELVRREAATLLDLKDRGLPEAKSTTSATVSNDN
jgi:hypothetical protein